MWPPPWLPGRNGGITVSNASGTALDVGTYMLINVPGGTITGTPLLNGSVQGAGLAGSDKASIQVNGSEVDLVVASGAGFTATSITNSLSGNVLTLNWPAGPGWNLQSNSVSLANPNAWQTVTGATPPYPITINPAQPAVYYRLTQP